MVSFVLFYFGYACTKTELMSLTLYTKVKILELSRGWFTVPVQATFELAKTVFK